METQEFLKAKGGVLDQYSQIQLYMALGGIPHYLKSILPGESTAQIIDRLCFAKDGPLKNEFKKLYKSLFANSKHHEAVVCALADKERGLTRKENCCMRIYVWRHDHPNIRGTRGIRFYLTLYSV